MIKMSVTKSGADTKKFLDKAAKNEIILQNIGNLVRQAQAALEAGTPKDSGETANSWDAILLTHPDRISIWFINNHVVDGFNVAVGLQYGHATRNRGYVQGYDYINPAVRPYFDAIERKIWKEIKKL